MWCLNGTKASNNKDEQENGNNDDMQDRRFVYRFRVHLTLLCSIINKRTQYSKECEKREDEQR